MADTQEVKDPGYNAADSSGEHARMTTDFGVKIEDPENWLRVMNEGVGGKDEVREKGTGPALLEDQIAREKIHRFDHERIPERVVHARGTGVHGYFQVFDAVMEKYTTAKVLTDPSRTTPVFVRFSTVQGSRGSADTVRDVRGFATKFYTQEGNWDLVGNNIPVFFIQDGIQFPDFVHAVKPEPHNEVPQGQTAHNNFWDFSFLKPETTHMLCWIMSDRAIPRSFRMMQGFGVNTFTLTNAQDELVFVKFHWLPELGVHSLAWDEALKISGQDPDFHRKDMEEAITCGAYAEYTLAVQIIKKEKEHDFGFDILDATKIWPQESVPLTPVGKMVLNRMVDEFFPETEQVAFCTSHVVPGIGFSDDPLLQSRNFSYFDTQISRLGINWEELPINRPVCPVMNFNRDGKMRHTIRKGLVNYYPNRLEQVLPVPKAQGGYASHPDRVDGKKERIRSPKFQEHYKQAQLFYNSLSPYEKEHVIQAFSFELSHCDDPVVYKRMSERLENIDSELARRVAVAVGGTIPEKGKRNHGETSKGLSQTECISKEPTIKGRRIAILIADGVNVTEVEGICSALEGGKATSWLIGPRRGIVYGAGQTAGGSSGLHTDHHFEGMRSTMFDAVIIPSGATHATALAKMGRVVHWIREAFGHLKPIGAIGEAVTLLEKAVQLPNIKVAPEGSNAVIDNYGVVTTRLSGSDAIRLIDRDETFLGKFELALSKHRNYQRELDGLVEQVAY
ncbi:catalase [Hysterangium stoloniferum]|nr:catalase [Hysterangium stoloniferum]